MVSSSTANRCTIDAAAGTASSAARKAATSARKRSEPLALASP
eukprot:CAMPEP_0183458426 /NCGR_PEP_ID=MMETSP0370-20130417/133479_1 /TAXON_ID=268820 /ORGANISM="Peridinium aciculiferum, Strain PAER-2" /LENGTH=42 /DNA_ID= /DNA_START= /DNA_END= /DNA_ORIENTATION=